MDIQHLLVIKFVLLCPKQTFTNDSIVKITYQGIERAPIKYKKAVKLLWHMYINLLARTEGFQLVWIPNLVPGLKKF